MGSSPPWRILERTLTCKTGRRKLECFPHVFPYIFHLHVRQLALVNDLLRFSPCFLEKNLLLREPSSMSIFCCFVCMSALLFNFILPDSAPPVTPADMSRSSQVFFWLSQGDCHRSDAVWSLVIGHFFCIWIDVVFFWETLVFGCNRFSKTLVFLFVKGVFVLSMDLEIETPRHTLTLRQMAN